jgi:hypothetical protein
MNRNKEIISNEEFLKKIKSRGFWKVTIRPIEYNVNRFENKQCKDILWNSQVNLLGWSYPFIYSINEIYSYSNYVEHITNWNMHLELLRMYNSGQYIHLFGLIEDWEENIRVFRPDPGILKPGDGLDMIITLNFITCVYDFCTKYSKNINGNEINLSIELNNTINRHIVTTEFGRFIYNHISKQEKITLDRQTNYTELSLKKYQFAIDDTIKIFEGFNWDDAPRQVLENEQAKILRNKS